MKKQDFLQILTTFANKFAAKIDSLFVRKDTGKGLSTNDFTNELKTKLDGVEAGANKTVVDEALSAESVNPVQNKVVQAALAGKSDTGHAHAFAEITETPITLAGYGITDAEASGAAAAALEEAKGYADQKITDLVNGAPETMDTLKEISDAMTSNASVVQALDEAIGSKANASDLTDHTGNTEVHVTADERSKWDDTDAKKHEHGNTSVLDAMTASYTTEEKSKLEQIAVMEEVTDEDIDAIIAGTFA